MSKVIPIAAVIVIVLVVGGIYFMQQPSSPSVTTTPTSTPTTHSPTITPTETQTPTPTPTETATPTPTEKPTPTPTVTEEDKIEEMIDGYYETFNKHSIEGNLAFFAPDGIKMINHGREGANKGHDKIRQQLSDVFTFSPDIALTEQEITKLEIDGDKAIVQVKYKGSASNWSSDDMTENMELVKIDGEWKIAKTDVVY